MDESTVMDSFALAALTYHYARVIDDRDFPGLHELLTDDATVGYGNPAATSVPIAEHWFADVTQPMPCAPSFRST
jgi:hypothetical protein